jgi:hypothetical protein
MKILRRQSNSSTSVPVIERVFHLWDLFLMRWRDKDIFDNSYNVKRISEYEALAAKHGIVLKDSQILEIGFGQRPYLGITFIGLGYQYYGIDLDLLFYPPAFAKIWKIYQVNGLLRLVKTLVRYFMFDKFEYSKLFKQLSLSPLSVVRPETFIQGNAATIDLALLTLSPAPCSIKMPLVVVSESVFEHIPRSDLSCILRNLKTHAEENGRVLLVLTRPTIFTGICGSHLTEWFHHNVYSSKPKKSQPWEHLRKNRFQADTYLNRLSRAESRELFEASGLRIAAETVEHVGLGSEFLADLRLREELSDWSDDELLSNEVMFELLLSSSSARNSE